MNTQTQEKKYTTYRFMFAMRSSCNRWGVMGTFIPSTLITGATVHLFLQRQSLFVHARTLQIPCKGCQRLSLLRPCPRRKTKNILLVLLCWCWCYVVGVGVTLLFWCYFVVLLLLRCSVVTTLSC